MANTGVAYQGSTGSAFFNPAGLASLRERKFSLTGNTYMHYRTVATPLLVVDGTDLDFSAEGTQIVPSSLVSTWTKGPWTFAFGVYVPEMLRTSFVQGFSTPNLEMELARTVDSQLLLVGLSAGATLEQEIDFGAGCFAGQYQVTQTLSFTGQPKAGSGITNAIVSNQYLVLDTKALLCQAGVQRGQEEDLRWGAVLRLPSLQVSGNGKYSQFVQDSTGQRTVSGIQSKSARSPIPMDLSLGLAKNLGQKILFLVDVSYQFPDEFEIIADFSGKIKSKGVARSSAGVEYGYSQALKIRAGLGYNPTGLELLKDYDNRENYTVVTVGGQYTDGASTTGLGLYYAKSQGESQLSSTRSGGLSTTVTAVMLNSGFVF